MPFLRRHLPLLTVGAAILVLYLYGLNRVGLLGPDEPRYAAIGRAMAASGDLITPKLWGSPWFEKPPLLYWMAASATVIGLPADLAARLPVALASLIFLAISFRLVRQEFGLEVAVLSTALLATSAGWVVYSGLCLTDLPLAACFSLAVLLSLPLIRAEPDLENIRLRFVLIGVCLGLAVLAKGLVPLALAVPFLWFLRRFWRGWWLSVIACAIVAGPWYAAVYAYNGAAFLEDFFWKHHIERLYSPSLHHVQPWYYYFPVCLAGLFPWTPLIGLLALGRFWRDTRKRFLAAVFCFGFLLFSVSLNKLPGYLLPLFPSLFVLLASQLERRAPKVARLSLIPCAVLISSIPMLARDLPDWLSQGRFLSSSDVHFTPVDLLYIAAPVAVVFAARPLWAVRLLVLCTAAGGIYLKVIADPVLDRNVSARVLWHEIKALPGTICDAGVSRDWQYGLAFYRGGPVPSCGTGEFNFALQPRPQAPPTLRALNEKTPTGPLDRPASRSSPEH